MATPMVAARRGARALAGSELPHTRTSSRTTVDATSADPLEYDRRTRRGRLNAAPRRRRASAVSATAAPGPTRVDLLRPRPRRLRATTARPVPGSARDAQRLPGRRPRRRARPRGQLPGRRQRRPDRRRRRRDRRRLRPDAARRRRRRRRQGDARRPLPGRRRLHLRRLPADDPPARRRPDARADARRATPTPDPRRPTAATPRIVSTSTSRSRRRSARRAPEVRARPRR